LQVASLASTKTKRVKECVNEFSFSLSHAQSRKKTIKTTRNKRKKTKTKTKPKDRAVQTTCKHMLASLKTVTPFISKLQTLGKKVFIPDDKISKNEGKKKNCRCLNAERDTFTSKIRQASLHAFK